VALRAQSMLLAALAVVATVGGWRIVGRVFQGTENPSLVQQIEANGRWPWDGAGAAAWSADDLVREPQGLLSGLEATAGLKGQAYWQLSRPFVTVFEPEVTFTGCVYAVACGLWALLVWALLGGAITRQAAVSLAREDRLSWIAAVGYARSKWVSYFTAPLYPMLAAGLLAVPLVLLGLLLNFGVGTLLAGLAWPVVVGVGFLMALLLVGLWLGWPLMWATISAEGTDAFDALSRSYSYVYQRPLRYVCYLLVAGLLGLVGWVLVAVVAQATIALAAWGVSWGSGMEDLKPLMGGAELQGAAYAGSVLVQFWTNLVQVLAAAFLSSYFWTSTTTIYFLLRYDVDAMEMDEVFVPEEDETYGLPALGEAAAGEAGEGR
jgi:hypothetical protein